MLSAKDTVMGMQGTQRNASGDAMRQSSLLRHLVDGNVRDFRRNALLCVGIVADTALFEEETVDHDSNQGNSQHSSASSEEEGSSSSGSDSEVETPRACNDEMCLPPDVPTPLYLRCRGTRFCAGYNIRSQCPDGMQSGLPPDVPIPSYLRTQEIILTSLHNVQNGLIFFL